MSAMLIAIAALSFAGILLTYVGYPLILLVIGRIAPRPVRRGRCDASVSLIVPAHDEEAVIAAKIANSLALAPRRGPLEILVVSDGSTDRTNEIAASVGDPRVRLLALPRMGKCRALDEAAAAARGEILVFTDANVMLEKDALDTLLEPFADPEVGGVGGLRRCRVGTGADGAARGEGLYWRYDTWLKVLESRIGSAFASDGSLHAVRRELYQPIERGDQADDIAISARVVVAGRRLAFEPEAVAWEDEPGGGGAELRRRARIVNHSLRAVMRLLPDVVRAGRFAYSLELLAHKPLRYLVPLFLVAHLATVLLLFREHVAFAGWALVQCVAYALAGAGALLRRSPVGRWRILSVPYFFCLVNLAALLGILSVLRGERLARWQPRGGAVGHGS